MTAVLVMTDEQQLAIEAIRVAIDKLTKPGHHMVERDDGSRIWATIPSLLDQAADALTGQGEPSGGRGGPGVERSPLDLDLMEACSIIAGTVRHELVQRDLACKANTKAQLRQLSAYVVGHEPDDLWWWEYRFTSWVRWLATYLQLYEHRPASVRLRNSPCPRCDIRQVIIDTDTGPVVVPPILIDFRDGYVRAAQCTACGAMWWRGVELERLARLLGATPCA